MSSIAEDAACVDCPRLMKMSMSAWWCLHCNWAVCSECIAVAFGPCCLRLGVCLPCGHFRPATAGTEQAVWCVKVLDNAQEALRVRMQNAETAAVEEGAAMRTGSASLRVRAFRRPALAKMVPRDCVSFCFLFTELRLSYVWTLPY